jgi:hypothetical protein
MVHFSYAQKRIIRAWGMPANGAGRPLDGGGLTITLH